MKYRFKINLILCVIPFLLLIFLFPFSQPNQVKASDVNYNQKVVAVVYDDSGSMSGSRHGYAKYAMQVLMSTLDGRDLLRVFPLNASAFDVDLKSQDRNTVVKNNANGLNASGGTYPTAITDAVNWFANNHGLNKNSNVDGKEFKLIVITDGAFNGGQSTSDTIGTRISGYVGLQTSFLGIGLDGPTYRVDELVQQNSSVKAYYADTADEIVDKMQEITNATTGRYKMSKGVTFDNNNKSVVYVDLNEYNFSIVSLGVLAQSNGASVALKSIESVTPLTKSRECNLSSSTVGLYGYSAMISCLSEDTHKYLYKEKIKLEFESAPTNVLVLLEPAIKLSATLEYYDGNSWVEIDEEHVNANLKVNDKVRTRYKLVDYNTSNDLTNVLKDVDIKVSYNRKVYKYDDAISLVEGKNEIALSVSVNISGAYYVLYNSWACDVELDPSQFKIVTDVLENYDGDVNKVRIDYSVYYDYLLSTQNELSGNNKKYSWEILVKDPDGNNLAYQSGVSGGTISIIFNKQSGKYGNYDVTFKIVRNENSKTRFSKTSIEQGLTKLELSTSNDIELTSFELRSNQNPFEFTLTDNQVPINFNSKLVGYSLKIDGVDLTEYAEIQGNVLKFIPNKNMPSILQKVKENDVVLEVWSLKNPNVNAKAVAKLNVLESIYKVEAIQNDDTIVDIYDLKNCQTKIYYKVSVDGHDFTKQELVDGLNDGLINVDYKTAGWVLLLPTTITTEVVTINGEDLICLSIGSNWASPLDNLFASFIFTGDKTLTVNCQNGSGDGIITLSHVNFLSRVWRWLVIITTIYLIVHTLLWILGFFIAKKLPKGAMVQIKFNPDKPKLKISVSSNLVNTELKTIILWHLRRYIPFMEFKDQESFSCYGVTLQVLDREGVMVHNKSRTIVKLDLDDDDASEAIRRYRRSWQEYVDGSKPSLKLTSKQLLTLIDDTGKDVNIGAVLGISEDYYATKNLKGRIDSIIFFKFID